MANIIRVEHSKERPFVVLSTEMVRDPNLDLQCKGMLAFLLAKPDNWQIRPENLVKELKECRATVYNIINKLIDAGYIYREVIRARNEDGTFKTASMYIVFEDKAERQAYIDRGRFNYERWKKGEETAF